ncbi:Growth hormone-regulated TBC protein 1-A [Liparis tanakae]|uniref:Growth hormone-regulated TBC protein 1-A n=1 Tax=Liparis tanakae TaxID=230148 RepID=A0A4Z2F0W3_9TELE|nr:Growth hormone-regulated TBC protein 1-A [Liparis tanakae]
MAASGAQERLEANRGYYQSLLAVEHDTRLEESIHTDMHRTFPDNVLFRGKAAPSLQRALFNVLLAYGHHNPAVGYCQLTANMTDFYHPAMMGLKTDLEVLGELVKAKAPAVGQLMAQYPGIWTLLVSRWFICLYIDTLPIEEAIGETSVQCSPFSKQSPEWGHPQGREHTQRSSNTYR